MGAFENKAPGTCILESEVLFPLLLSVLLALSLLVCAWVESRMTAKSGAGNVSNGGSRGSVGSTEQAIDRDTDS